MFRTDRSMLVGAPFIHSENGVVSLVDCKNWSTAHMSRSFLSTLITYCIPSSTGSRSPFVIITCKTPLVSSAHRKSASLRVRKAPTATSNSRFFLGSRPVISQSIQTRGPSLKPKGLNELVGVAMTLLPRFLRSTRYRGCDSLMSEIPRLEARQLNV